MAGTRTRANRHRTVPRLGRRIVRTSLRGSPVSPLHLIDLLSDFNAHIPRATPSLFPSTPRLRHLDPSTKARWSHDLAGSIRPPVGDERRGTDSERGVSETVTVEAR